MKPVEPVVVNLEIAKQCNPDEVPASRSSFFANIFNNLSNMWAKVHDYGNHVLHMFAEIKDAIILKVSAIFDRIINYFKAFHRSGLSSISLARVCKNLLENIDDLELTDEGLKHAKESLQQVAEHFLKQAQVEQMNVNVSLLRVYGWLNNVKSILTNVKDSLNPGDSQDCLDIQTKLSLANNSLQCAYRGLTLMQDAQAYGDLNHAFDELSDAEAALNKKLFNSLMLGAAAGAGF